MNVIAMDVANSCGFAKTRANPELHPAKHGTLIVEHREGEPEPRRFWRMYCAVGQLALEFMKRRNGPSGGVIRTYPDLFVVVEGAPGFTFGLSAVRVSNELRGAIKVWCGQYDVPYYAVNPGTLKKFATGHGKAKKPEMIAAARDRWGYQGRSDDEADAIIMREWALSIGENALLQRIAKKAT